MFAYTFQSSLRTEAPLQINDDLTYYLVIYVAISLGASIIGTIRFLYIFLGSLKASKTLFERLTFTVLRTPLRWVDTVPLGRILNRFTADFNIVDSRLAYDVSFFGGAVLSLVGVIVAGYVITYGVPQFQFFSADRRTGFLYHLTLFS